MNISKSDKQRNGILYNTLKLRLNVFSFGFIKHRNTSKSDKQKNGILYTLG